MPISDIFTTPFLICLGICLLLLGLLGMYFTQKIMEQNHKITSMFELVSTMAEEMNSIRSNIMMPQQFQPQFNMMQTQTQPQTQMQMQMGGLTESLIPVSDDEEDDDDEDDDDDDDDEDDDEDDDDDEDEDEGTMKIKSIKFNNLETPIFNEIENLEELQILDEDDDDDDDDNDDDDDDDDDDTNINITEEITLVESELEEMSEFTNLDFEKVANGINEPDAHLTEDLGFLKSINLENLEENKSFQVVDYKKLSLEKLKSLVVEKGLVTDSTKMKKNELLSLLGSD